MKYHILLLVMVFFATGCSEEDDLQPSYSDVEWFVLQDNLDDAVQHAAYGVYSTWGIPVFCNDTIGSQERGLDHNGNPIVYYKVLDLNYNLNNPTNAFSINAKHISLIRDEADKLAGIKFVDEVLLPNVPEIFYIQSILLLDSIYEQQYVGGAKSMKAVHQAMETLAVADIPVIANMSQAEKIERANEIITYLAIKYLAKNPSSEIETFKKVSYDPATQRSYYGRNVRTPNYPGESCLAPARWEVYGFLDYSRDNYPYVTDPDITKWRYRIVKEDEDIEDYIMAVVSYSKAEFEGMYAEYPMVLEKFLIMRGVMESIGFELK